MRRPVSQSHVSELTRQRCLLQQQVLRWLPGADPDNAGSLKNTEGIEDEPAVHGRVVFNKLAKACACRRILFTQEGQGQVNIGIGNAAAATVSLQRFGEGTQALAQGVVREQGDEQSHDGLGQRGAMPVP